MRTVLATAIETFAQTLEAFRNNGSDAGQISKFVGVSPVAHSIRSKIELAARITDKHILITGPTGSGKSLAAQLIHDLSERKNTGAFHALNCSAIPADLAESELFGHEMGSFTGATNRRRGYFEMADRGTLFLDEVGEASQAVQAKLLRVIETGEFYRVGGHDGMISKARVIAATNLELGAALREKKFREDLYYRLYGLGIHIPPLQDRLEDLSYLAAAFVVQQEKKQCSETRYVFQDDAIERLYGHSWPGNARELRAVIENAMLIATENCVTADDIEFPPIYAE